jgi:deoxyribose-phosphate aldolase
MRRIKPSELLSLDLTAEKLAKMIDHTVLKAQTKRSKVKQICDEALLYQFAAVCINPVQVEYTAELLKDSDVKVCSVIGFPLGATTPEVKAYEAKKAVQLGAHEIDMVMNIGAMRDQNHDLVKKDIEAVVSASGDAHVKVILETGHFIDDDTRQACLICKEAGADFVKTSTGFGPMGATPHDVKLMRETVGKKMGVKAAGGIRTFKDAIRLIEAGADRIGASAGVAIVEDFRWAQYSDTWTEPDKPCWTCPSRQASLAKQPKEVYLWYKQRCVTCPHREDNIFND